MKGKLVGFKTFPHHFYLDREDSKEDVNATAT